MSYVHNATAHTAAMFGPAAAPIAWTDLDLSTVVGANVVFAVLKFECTGGVDPVIAVRPNGDADEYYSAANTAHGATRAYISKLNESCLLACLTDSAGKIEWRASAASTVEISLLGYCWISVDSTNVIPDAAWPTTWTEADIGTIVGHRSTMAVFKFHRTGGTQNSGSLRPADDGDDYLVVSPQVAGPNQDGDDAINIYSNTIVKTDTSGKFDYISEAAAINAKLDMACYCPLTPPTVGEEQVYALAAPPLAWADLDLRASTGPLGVTGLPTNRSLVMLKFHHENAAGASTIAVRAKDDAGDYITTKASGAKGCACATLEADETTILVTETDGNGVIQWMSDLNLQYDVELLGWVGESSGPGAGNFRPLSDTFVNDGPIGATIVDEDGIDLTTIGLTVTSPTGVVTNIVTAGTVQSPFTGTIVSVAPGDRIVEVNCFGSLDNGELQRFTMTATSKSGSTL